jgi:predicted helicase
MFFFVRKNTEGKEDYEKGFQLNDLFLQFSTGILTKNDDVAIAFHKNEMWGNVKKFFIESEESLRSLFNLKRDSRDWVLKKAIDDIRRNYSEDNIVTVSYRPFDSRYTYYTGTSRGFMAYSQMRVMHNLFNKKNLALVSGRQGQVVGGMEWNLLFATKDISDLNIFYRGGGTVFPLYVYDRDSSRTPNFNMEIVDEIEKNVGKVSPEDIFDYIYAVLHSPSYREKYKEFLKIDFPHVPYPKDTITFKKLVAFGAELRSLHLLESPKANQFITTYPIVGSDTVEKLTYKNGNVFINPEQYFGNVPEVAWNFYIGGYQPAQKWLKDRKGRALTNTDIEHYQKIIVALAETNRIMKEIDSNT